MQTTPETTASRDPRERVMGHLLSIVSLFPDLPIDAPDQGGLTPRDAALARAIDGAVRRRWLTLTGAASTFLNRPFESLDEAARVGLLVGAAQLLLLDRVPDHAAIDSAVGWTKRTQGKGVAGLVNAVLRNIARRRDAAAVRPLATSSPAGPLLDDRDLPLPDGSVLVDMLPSRSGHARVAERLSMQCSLAHSLVEAWIESVGEAVALRRGLCSIVPAPTILRFDPDDALPSGLTAHERSGYALYDTEAGSLASFVDHARGRWVQDPGSAEALDLIAPGSLSKPPQRIVDLCAGRGTKTQQLARLYPDAQVVASDPDPDRLATLRATFRDTPRVLVTTDREAAEHGTGADLVVIDVPCSNSGVLARRLEARYRHDPYRQTGLVNLQQKIFARAVNLAAPDGLILYITCSLEREENDHPWSEIALANGERTVEIAASHRREPADLPGEAAARHLDGGGATLLQVGLAPTSSNPI